MAAHEHEQRHPVAAERVHEVLGEAGSCRAEVIAERLGRIDRHVGDVGARGWHQAVEERLLRLGADVGRRHEERHDVLVEQGLVGFEREALQLDVDRGADRAPNQPLRGQRRDEALQRFDRHRDNAQYQAAMERWRSNDPFTCEAQLRGIVRRNPEHLEARQALADLMLDRGDAAAAEQELRELLKVSPDNPQTHHSLGLLLQSLDRDPEAQPHLQRAAELAPDNTLYQLCVQPPKAVPPIVASRELP